MNIRRLATADTPEILPLIAELGYPTTADAFERRAAAVCACPDGAVLVAERDANLLGFIAFHSFDMLHRPGRLGRITALVVAASARGRGVGSELLKAAEHELLARGCIKLEVTSAEHRAGAHSFYASHGYAEQRVRFTKSAPPPHDDK